MKREGIVLGGRQNTRVVRLHVYESLLPNTSLWRGGRGIGMDEHAFGRPMSRIVTSAQQEELEGQGTSPLIDRYLSQGLYKHRLRSMPVIQPNRNQIAMLPR